jgi:parallel beta-helix repeat protein
VTGNTVSNNSGIYGAGNGITIEVSCNATINSNVASGNYLAGIQVRNSHDVNVGAVGAGNTVSGSVKAMRSLKFSGAGTWQGTYRQDLSPGGSCGT